MSQLHIYYYFYKIIDSSEIDSVINYGSEIQNKAKNNKDLE